MSRVKAFVPIVISISIAWFFSFLIILSNMEPPTLPLTPFSESTNGQIPGMLPVNPAPYLNTLIFLGAVFAGSMFLVIFLKHLKKFVKILVTCALWLITFFVSSFYALLFTGTDIESVWLPVAALVATAITYVSTSKRGLLSLLSCGFVGGSVGTILSNSMPFWTAIVLLLVISAYDALAVFRGHLRMIKEHDLESLRGFIVEYDNLIIGLGDMFFYSFLVSFATLHMGVLASIGGALGITLGYFLTLKLLEKRRMLPGLPGPILIGLCLALLFSNL